MLSLTVGPLTSEEMGRAIQALQSNGIAVNGSGAPQGMPAAPPRPAGGLPPPPGTQAAPPPAPPTVPPPQAQQNPKIAAVLEAMDKYSRAGHQIAGARKVLAVLNLQRVQDATDEQLDWLAQAFANTAWTP